MSTQFAIFSLVAEPQFIHLRFAIKMLALKFAYDMCEKYVKWLSVYTRVCVYIGGDNFAASSISNHSYFTRDAEMRRLLLVWK